MSLSFPLYADGDMSSQDVGASVSIPRQTPPRSPGTRNPVKMGVDDWVHHTQRRPPPPANGHDFLGADPSGGHRGRGPPVRNGYPGTQGNRDDISSRAVHAPHYEGPSNAATVQIAVHKTAWNPTITNAPAVAEDIVMCRRFVCTLATEC